MKKIFSFCLIITSFAAFATPDPDCVFWENEVSVFSKKIEKLDEKLLSCERDLQCREIWAFKNTLEGLRDSYLSNLEAYCN